MRIAICDDSQREQEQFIKALHGWNPTRQPECFMTGVSLLEADWNWPDATATGYVRLMKIFCLPIFPTGKIYTRW